VDIWFYSIALFIMFWIFSVTFLVYILFPYSTFYD